MANKIDTEIPSKHTDWEGYAGSRVQEYIKNQLEGKVGYFYPDSANNRVLVFADEENANLYLEDPTTHAELLIFALDTPSEYSASIELVDTPIVNYVSFGSVGHVIQADFSIVNKEGQPTGEVMNVTVTFRNGSAVQKLTRTASPGARFSLNVDEYLREGTNVITIGIVGQNTLAATTVGVTFHAINLSLSDTMDISQVYRSDVPGTMMNILFTVAGSGTKYLEWYIDNQQLDFDGDFDVVTQPSVTREKRINIYNLGLDNGRHTLQYRAYVEIEAGLRFYSDVLWRDFIVSNGYLTTNVIATAFSIPSTNGVVANPQSEPIPLHGIEQYTGKSITYSIFSPRNIGQVAITLDGETKTFTVENYMQYNYDIMPYNFGTVPLVFTAGEQSLSFNAYIDQSSFNIEEITNGLTFAFSGKDRTNESSDRSSWSFRDYIATFTGFQWTKQSGWTEDGLVIPGGASLTFNKGPMADEPKANGATFEFEYETRHVLDDNAVICDLRTNNVGLLITASEASVTSSGGARVSTKYRAGEPIRVAFVINKASGVRNLKLVFIYIDGILSGAVPYDETDSFRSQALLSIAGSVNATIVLKYMRFYNRALDMDEILNNFVLYRPTVQDLVEYYNHNDIQSNTVGQPDYDKLSAQLPCMVITGNVDRLQHFTRDDKGTYVYMEKLEYTHPTDPTKNFILEDFSLRCQGTSSMDYPRKNFRFYLQKDSADETVPSYVTKMYDYEGNELTGKNRKYAFKNGSQAVKTFCLKADYAESSSTHNTGIARLWNDVMKNARIDNVSENYYRNTQYPCRTMVQQAAMDNNYGYDVRTTIDGFPIALFYKPTASSPLQFLGKYNFNNDKSTESVFGFCDVPGFDFDEIEDEEGNVIDSNVQCWEVVNGDYDINQFVDMSGWDNGRTHGGWEDSFESRYPDDASSSAEADRAQTALKGVCYWINSTKGASKVQNGKMVVDDQAKMNKFKTEKWDWLDVYKVAAYYVFLMRFGAVDQTVKNAMFTCEDCHGTHQHWFYINYDNDTINGLSNAGDLRFNYTIDRQTNDGGVSSYAYAGHASVLWNNLEADNEFMDIVKVVDQALYNAGLTYTNVIRMFNINQSAQWAERLHNYDYNYKYIGVWLDKIDSYDQLAKLQGARRTHRAWWLSNRFAIYDAKNRTGQYKESSFNIKPQTGDYTPGEYVAITPAVNNQIFGYRVGSSGTEVVEEGEANVPILFYITKNYYIGESHFFQNMVYAKSIDLSAMSHHVEEVNLAGINSDIFDSNITEIIISSLASETNNIMTTVNGYNKAKYLERFIMCNVISQSMGSKSLDFSDNGYLKYIDMRNSTYLTAITLPDAAPITEIHLPSSIQSLILRNLNLLATLDVQSNGENIATIEAYNTPVLANDPTWFLNWFDHKTIASEDCSVYIDNIAWEGITVQELLDVAQIGNLALKGQILVSDLTTEEQAMALMEAYGPRCFEQSSELWLRSLSPLSFLSGPAEVNEGENAQYTLAYITPYPGTISYEVRTARSGVSMDADTGILTTTLNDAADSSAIITGIYTFDDISKGSEVITKNIIIKKRTYPSDNDVTINGDAIISNDTIYTATVEGSFTGETTHAWELTGLLATYFRIDSHTKGMCVLKRIDSTFVYASGTLTYKLYKTISGTTTQVCQTTKTLTAKSGEIAVLRSENGPIMTAFWNAYGTGGSLVASRGQKIANQDYITKTEARAFTGEDLNPTGGSTSSIFYAQRNNITHFEELQYFTGLVMLPAYCFNWCQYMNDIPIPDTVLTINKDCFDYCYKLRHFNANNVTKLNGSTIFSQCTGLIDFIGPHVTELAGNSIFQYCRDLKEIILPECTNFTALGVIGPGTSSLINLYTPKLKQGTNYILAPNGSISHGADARWTVGPLTNVMNYAIRGMSYGWTLIMSKYCNVDIPYIWRPDSNATPFKAYEVEEGNEYYDIRGGCVVKKSNNTVMAIPNAGNVVIPDTVTAIAQDAGRRCSSLQGISIPSSVTSIGGNVFNSCSELKNITLDCSATPPSNTFSGCTAVESIHIGPNYSGGLGEVAQSLNHSGHDTITSLTVDPNNARFYSSGNCIVQRSNEMLNLGCNSSVIPPSIKGIWNYAFSFCKHLSSVDIPSAVTSLGQQTFENCPELGTIYIRCITAPSGTNTWGNSDTNATGLNHRSDGTNMLYVPSNATGYSGGIWSRLLSSTGGGFTLSATL